MQNKFFELLEEENKKGVTIFFSSHILGEVQRICDRVAIIKEGRILKIEQIEKLRATQYKKFTIEFNNIDDSNKFDIHDITRVEKKNKQLEFLYAGDINIILGNLAQMNIANLLIEEPSLEEIFLHYYEKEGE